MLRFFSRSTKLPSEVQALLDRGLIRAIQKGQLLETISLIEKGANYTRISPVRLACQYGHLKVAQWFLPRVKPSYAKAVTDPSTLLHAVSKGYLDIVKWLVSMDASLDSKIHSLLVVACEHGHLETARWLYQQGIRDSIDEALKEAYEEGHSDVILWLNTIVDCEA
jgi:hypothetical protein